MNYIECELSQILLTENPASAQVIVLRERDGERAFPIQIGFFEALAINRHIHGEEMVRPMTHDLLVASVEALGGEVVRVLVSDLVEDQGGGATFYGRLMIERGEEEVDVDCRPSDAIAIAVRTGCPIYVAEQVLLSLDENAE